MKKIILATVSMATLYSSLTVLAGPDFYVIEKARAARHAEARHTSDFMRKATH